MTGLYVFATSSAYHLLKHLQLTSLTFNLIIIHSHLVNPLYRLVVHEIPWVNLLPPLLLAPRNLLVLLRRLTFPLSA